MPLPNIMRLSHLQAQSTSTPSQRISPCSVMVSIPSSFPPLPSYCPTSCCFVTCGQNGKFSHHQLTPYTIGVGEWEGRKKKRRIIILKIGLTFCFLCMHHEFVKGRPDFFFFPFLLHSDTTFQDSRG